MTCDIQDIGGKTYVNRSGWRKLQSAFAISDRTLSKDERTRGKGTFYGELKLKPALVRPADSNRHRHVLYKGTQVFM